MAPKHFVAVKCRLSKGLFSSERAFEVVLANQEKHSGPVPRHFCWNAEGNPLREAEAVSEEVDGLIAARVVDELEQGRVIVEVPDGEVLAVRKDLVVPRPTPIHPPAAASA